MIVISSFILFKYRAQLIILSNRSITYGLEISIVVIVFITVFFYNKNFPFEVIDYSKTDILLKNIYQFFSDLPVT